MSWVYRALVAALLLAVLAPAGRADTRVLSWDYPPAQAANIDGFRLYCGPAAGVYAPAPVSTVNATTLTANAAVPAGSNNFCVVRAYKAAVESPPSNEVSFVGRPDAPTNLRVSLTISWSEELGRYVARNVTVRKVP